MGLEYDFDIVAIAPDEVDPEHGVAAVTGNRAVRALFRDFRTAQALRSASPKIRRIFLESGFSLETRSVGGLRGFYPATDALDRERILKRLFANIRNMGVQGEHCGDFDFWHFLRHIRAAQPVDVKTHKAPLQPLPPQEPEPPHTDRRTLPGRIGFGLALTVLVFVLLKYLAALGATQ